MAILFEDRVALAVSHSRIGRRANRQRRRRPELAGRLIAQIDHFARRIRYRIVVPGREAIRLAVARPGIAKARFRREEAARGISDDVDPGSWRKLEAPFETRVLLPRYGGAQAAGFLPSIAPASSNRALSRMGRASIRAHPV